MESSLALLVVWLAPCLLPTAVFEVDAWAVKSINQALASQNRQTKHRHLHYSSGGEDGASGSKLEQFTVAWLVLLWGKTSGTAGDRLAHWCSENQFTQGRKQRATNWFHQIVCLCPLHAGV